MEEQLLLDRMRQRDETALEELMKEYEAFLIRVVSQILVPYMTMEDVQEVVSDTFYSVWRRADALDLTKGTLRAYLAASARNGAKNKFRGFRGELPLQEYDMVETESLFDRMEQEEKSRIIGEILSEMKEKELEILIRYYYFYENTTTIAVKMNLRVNTVKSLLRRGRKKMEKRLRERGICR